VGQLLSKQLLLAQVYEKQWNIKCHLKLENITYIIVRLRQHIVANSVALRHGGVWRRKETSVKTETLRMTV